MLLGLMADVHDHLDNLRLAVQVFNDARCETVLFAGDLVSTFAVPPLRKLACPFVGCFGDNEGNRTGLLAGIRIVGRLEEPPLLWTADDGTRFVLVHMERQLRDLPPETEFDFVVCGHTHKPFARKDDQGRLSLNPGEIGGWTFGRPTVMLFDTRTRQVETIDLKTVSADVPFTRSATP